jgi:hypothetical protein
MAEVWDIEVPFGYDVDEEALRDRIFLNFDEVARVEFLEDIGCNIVRLTLRRVGNLNGIERFIALEYTL